MKNKINKNMRKLLVGIGIILILVIVLASIGYLMGYRTFKMAEGASMVPTLAEGDMLIVKSKVNPKTLKTGDIIVIDGNCMNREYHLTKRVIGIPGDRIYIKSDSVFINNIYLEEPYASYDSPLAQPFEKTSWIVGEGELFLIGDNRNNSMDSRYDAFGMIKFHCIFGKVVCTF
jgi:signal peptidase I